MRKDRYTPVDTPKRWRASNDKKAKPIAIDTQKDGATNEKKARDMAVVSQKDAATNEKKASAIAVNAQKWGVSNDKTAKDTSVVTPLGDPLMKKARDIAFDTQNGGATNEKKARDMAVDTQKWGASNEKKARPISVFTQKWGASNDMKAMPIPFVSQKGAATNEKKASDIAVNTQKWEATNDKTAGDISVNTPMAPIMKKARIISVVTQKGGVGKTATAINMSVGLHNLGYKVAAIDLDPQGQLAEGFGISRKSLKKTMFDVLLGSAHMKSIKQRAYGVDLYLSNRSLADLGVTVQTPPNVERYPNPYSLLKQALAEIETKYDFIIIDTPPTVSIFNKNALNASTDAVIPMQPEGMAVKGAEDMLELIRDVQKNTNRKLNILGILATMVQNY